MTKVVAYHSKTADLALFNSDEQFWIGSYNSFLTHQNGEPPYVLIDGYFSNEQEGLARLAELSGNEF